jgi:hypothetical protein
MKFETLNGILTFVLGVLIILSVCLAVRMVMLHHDLRMLQKQATQDQAIMMQTEQVFNDAAVYNQKNPSPDLTRIIQSMSPKRNANH